jgi:hypothetical protein
MNTIYKKRNKLFIFLVSNFYSELYIVEGDALYYTILQP